ncbi:AAA family ATPase [Pseudonocardia ailaonensis]|uniref:AAA family ATPase n=1 Tax=Pseudonocardia ailaonensis TaxID=367279 RepID=A0ABN2MWQ4_9PSEU
MDLAAAVLERAPGPGGCRLVAVDGFSGSGKSALAGELGRALDAPVISVEELYPGWSGLTASIPLALEWIGAPLFRGEPARWWPWDWPREERSPHPRTQAVVPVVVLEGCGSGAAALRPVISTLIWADCPPGERERRLRARPDWPGYAPHRAAFAHDEAAHFAVDRTAEHADLVVDTLRTPPP